MGALSARLKKKLVAGLNRSITYVAETFSEDVSVPVKRLTATSLYEIRSLPGEFPREDTGVGRASIEFDVNEQTFQAAAGVTEEGFHLYELAHDLETIQLVKGPRKFIDDTFLENLNQVKTEFINGARSV